MPEDDDVLSSLPGKCDDEDGRYLVAYLFNKNKLNPAQITAFERHVATCRFHQRKLSEIREKVDEFNKEDILEIIKRRIRDSNWRKNQQDN